MGKEEILSTRIFRRRTTWACEIMRSRVPSQIQRYFRSRFVFGIFAGLSALVLIAGCGPGVKKNLKAVSGTVKYRGAPLANGSIQFAPTADSKATTQESSDVHDGKYEIPASRGLEPGKYQVRIFSTGAERDPQTGRRPGGRADQIQLPEQYNIKSKLEREVKVDAANTIDFDLK